MTLRSAFDAEVKTAATTTSSSTHAAPRATLTHNSQTSEHSVRVRASPPDAHLFALASPLEPGLCRIWTPHPAPPRPLSPREEINQQLG